MTGRELILYILENGLEDEPVFKNGRFIGFLTAGEVALQTNVGVATVHAWIKNKNIPGVLVSEGLYIPGNYKAPVDAV